MVRLVILGGTGDVYLVCSLFAAFKERHNREAEVILRGRYACIAQMFDVPYVVDEATITTAETDHALQRDYDNVIGDSRYFYTHPCFLRSQTRVDHMTTKPDASQADMYKMILRIPPDTPLALPRLPHTPNVDQRKVVLIPRSTSWPNEDPAFWAMLGVYLSERGWNVVWNDASWSLAELFAHCSGSAWVIGPQCGVMSILVTGRFPCRKTFAVASVDDNNAPGFLPTQTYPYAYVTKFSNQDYDVEEFKVVPGRHTELVEQIANGVNALRLWPHDPAPVTSVMMPLTPGDFLDREAVLSVKYQRFSREKKAAIVRELHRYQEAHRLARFSPEVEALFGELRKLHEQNFDRLEKIVPFAMLRDDVLVENHLEAIADNRKRVELKQLIDDVSHAPYKEVKSYYRDPAPVREAAE